MISCNVVAHNDCVRLWSYPFPRVRCANADFVPGPQIRQASPTVTGIGGITAVNKVRSCLELNCADFNTIVVSIIFLRAVFWLCAGINTCAFDNANTRA